MTKFIFLEFIKIKLNLEDPNHFLIYKILDELQVLYHSGNLPKLREVINKSKEYNHEITICIMPSKTLRTGADWNPHGKIIRIESPDDGPLNALASMMQECLISMNEIPKNLHEEFTKKKEDFHSNKIMFFIEKLLHELCNSANKYFSSYNRYERFIEFFMGRPFIIRRKLQRNIPQVLKYYLEKMDPKDLDIFTIEFAEYFSNHKKNELRMELKKYIIKNYSEPQNIDSSTLYSGNNKFITFSIHLKQHEKAQASSDANQHETFSKYWENVNKVDPNTWVRHSDAYASKRGQLRCLVM